MTCGGGGGGSCSQVSRPLSTKGKGGGSGRGIKKTHQGGRGEKSQDFQRTHFVFLLFN